MATRTTPTGLRERHSRRCRSREGGSCNCTPSIEAWVYSARKSIDGKPVGKIYRTFNGKGALAAAKGWRIDALHAKKGGTLRPATRRTVRQAAEELIAGMKDGSILTKKGKRYRPAVIRGHERVLGLTLGERELAPLRVCEVLGDYRLSELDRQTVQEEYVNRLIAAGWSGSTVANHLDPLRVIVRRARRANEIVADPLEGLELPEPNRRKVIPRPPEEAARLLEALPEPARALWATALYAGLRRGELRALRCMDLDLGRREIHVQRGWDDREGEQEPKTDKANRRVPIIGRLAPILMEHQMRTGRRGRQLVFGTGEGDEERPFDPTQARRDAIAAWEEAGIEPLGFHEARHNFASILIAAGVDVKGVTDYLGHSSVTMSFDLYGHLFANAREQAIRRVDRFLDGGDGSLAAVD